MIKNDYLEELGLTPLDKKVSWPLAITFLILLAMLAAGLIFYAYTKTKVSHPSSKENEHPAAFTETHFAQFLG
jgi:hypothetical protein